MKVIKLALIGDGNVGKTTFIKIFDHKAMLKDNPYDSSVGTKIEPDFRDGKLTFYPCSDTVDSASKLFFPRIDTEFDIHTFCDYNIDTSKYDGVILMYRDDIPSSFHTLMSIPNIYKKNDVPLILVCNQNYQGYGIIKNEEIVNTLMNTPVGRYSAYYELSVHVGIDINKPFKFFTK